MVEFVGRATVGGSSRVAANAPAPAACAPGLSAAPSCICVEATDREVTDGCTAGCQVVRADEVHTLLCNSSRSRAAGLCKEIEVGTNEAES